VFEALKKLCSYIDWVLRNIKPRVKMYFKKLLYCSYYKFDDVIELGNGSTVLSFNNGLCKE
jgi:hypothetical protein